ncbi:arrestin domain-containing protein 17 [Anastrepha ludens]|uniref:arrestin domain-containing protein 17 n=1 Tax=Anastrepha ludens TaxID=28586 RepID=UPI0023B15277|nr:arrestin domain-containing protein 17 [Anastrepha ludens]
MSVLHCEVQLDNQKAIYEPGDKLTGQVTLTLEVRLLLKAAAIKYTGFAEVQWQTLLPPKKTKKSKRKKKQQQETSSDAEVPEQRIEVYTNREDFLSSVNYFIGSEEATARIVNRGTYTYPFSLTLPQSCPCSFEGLNGHIRYMIEVFVDHKNKREIWYTQQLRVVKPLDLRHCPQVTEQNCDVHVKEQKFCRIFKKSLEMVVNLQQIGFVPGEALSAHVKIQNHDKLNLKQITYELHQICRITASHGHKNTKTQYFLTNLAKAVHNLGGTQKCMEEHLQMLLVPQTVPSSDENDCRCLHISYELSVWLSTNKANRWLQAKIPITVGTVPLNSVEEARPWLKTGQEQVFEEHSGNYLSKSNLLSSGMEVNSFVEPTAPDPPETPELSMSMMSLASSSFREAEYLPKTKFDVDTKKSKHKKDSNQTDFKPKYLYYDMNSGSAAQNVELTASPYTTVSTTTTATSTTDEQTERRNRENNAFGEVLQQLARQMQARRTITET